MQTRHFERHYSRRINWLRAAVLGANDGIISTASLVVGVAAAGAARSEIIVAGVTGLVAGAMSMAAGEYVSVSSQADTVNADLEREKDELANNVESELEELANIYVGRGLEPDLAKQVALQLMEHDALGAHARDELGLSEVHSAHPIQAAFASAATFALGAAVPVLLVLITPISSVFSIVPVSTLIMLAILGAIAAQVGGANRALGAARVTFWGLLAMTFTSAVGSLVGMAF